MSQAQDVEAGDGTTSVVVLAGSLLRACELLLEKGYFPQAYPPPPFSKTKRKTKTKISHKKRRRRRKEEKTIFCCPHLKKKKKQRCSFKTRYLIE